MATIQLKEQYHCDNDCLQEGCPSHEATLTFQSTASIYTWNDGQGNECYFDMEQMRMLIKMAKHLSQTRGDTVKV